MNHFGKNLAFSAAIAAWTLACGGAILPSESLTTAKEEVSAAEAMGARDEPQADLHLKLAEDGIVEAEALIADKRNEEAAPKLERAIADAQLARELTEKAEKKAAAETALARLETLEQGSIAQGN
jgi:hypothetical protein